MKVERTSWFRSVSTVVAIVEVGVAITAIALVAYWILK